MRHFVVRHRINFVCVSAAGQLPKALRPLVRLQLLDSVTGEQFYMLKV